MADFPVLNREVTPLFIHPYSPEWTLGLDARILTNGTTLAAVTQTANRAHYLPLSLPYSYLVRRMFWVNGTTVTSSNVDVGIYSEDGTRLYSSGSTAMSGPSVPQFVTLSTPLLLPPGRYYIAYVCDGTGARGWAITLGADPLRQMASFQQATALPLPASATFAAATNINLPFVGITRTDSGF